MKSRFFFSCLIGILMLVPPAMSQKLEVGLVGGYRTGGNFRFDTIGPLGQLNSVFFETDSTPDLSFQIDAPVQEYASAELIFDFTNTTMSARESNAELQAVGVKIYTIHAGGIYTTSQEKVRPILGASLGASIFNPDNGSGSTTRFSMGFTGGAKAYLSDAFGIRAQTRLVMALVQSANFFCGPGGGSCYTAGGSLFTQIDFGLGLFLLL